MAWCVALLAVLFGPSAGALAEREDPYEGLDREQVRVYQNYSRLFCTQFFRFNETRFVILPNHSPRRENSSGRTYDEAEAEMTQTRVVVRAGVRYEEKILPPAGEVIAWAMVIPDIEVGHYGHINSVVVDKILGPDEMIVRDLLLIPPDQVGTEKNELRRGLRDRQRQYAGKRYRLLGFDTAGLMEGQTYLGPDRKGLHIAVMSTDPEHRFVLVDFTKLERTKTNEFTEVLRYVKLEPAVFIDMVRDNRERHNTKGDRESLISLYKRFYSRYLPKKVTTEPQIAPEEPKPKPEIPQPKPEPEQPKPEPEQPKPEQPKPVEQPKPKPKPIEKEEEEDDWEYEENNDKNKEAPNFFGIPF